MWFAGEGLIHVGPRNHVLDGADPYGKGHFWEDMGEKMVMWPFS